MEGSSEGTVHWGDGGRYAIHDPIGSGGVGQVFLAHDTHLNRWVAIKRLHPGNSEEAEQRAAAAIEEAQHLAALQHPNIVTVFDFLREGGDVLVVMEFIQGHTLQQRAEAAPLDAEAFPDFARQALEGLVAAHSLGMIHRDIKPGNLMFASLPSGSWQVKVLDFGTARIQPAPSLQTVHQDGAVLGSVFFMAPEQFDQQPLDARTDLYAFGCCCYFALTGRYPFVGETISDVMVAHLQHRLTPLDQLRPDLPSPLRAWVERLMALSPDDRPADGTAALAELKAALALPPAGRTPGTRSSPPPPAVGPGARPPAVSRTGSAGQPSRPAPINRPSPKSQKVPLPPTPPPPAIASKSPTPIWAWILAASALVLIGVAAFLFWPKKSTGEPQAAPQNVAPIFSPPPPAPGAPASPATPAPTQTATASSAPAAPSSANSLAPTDREGAIRAEGKTVEVRGRIGRAGANKSGTIRYLNFAEASRGDLSLVFFVDKPGGEAFSDSALSGFVGKDVRVSGEISLYNGNPQIVIRDLSQIHTD